MHGGGGGGFDERSGGDFEDNTGGRGGGGTEIKFVGVGGAAGASWRLDLPDFGAGGDGRLVLSLLSYLGLPTS